MVSAAWVGCVVILLALGTVVSVGEIHSFVEVRIGFTRSNLIGLLAVLVVPPGCVILQWWLMRERRRGRWGERRQPD